MRVECVRDPLIGGRNACRSSPTPLRHGLERGRRSRGEFQRDADAHSEFWAKGYDLLDALPEKPKRNPDQARAAETILRAGRESREAFMLRHARAVYAALTKDQTKFVRADVLAYEAAALVPGLTPTRAQVYAQGEKMQRDKDGIEVDQGIFFAHVLARPDTGTHFCHAMLLPRPESLARLDEFTARGALDLGTAAVMRQGKATTVFMRNPRYLNAEDEATLQQTEIRGRSRDPRSEKRAVRAARRHRRQSEIRRQARVLDRHQSHPHLPRQDFVHVVRDARDGLREQDDARARAARRQPGRNLRRHDREAVDRGRRAFRDRRRLPVPAHDGLRGGGKQCLHDAARAQGGHHSGRRQHAACGVSPATGSRARRSCRGGGSIATRRRGA